MKLIVLGAPGAGKGTQAHFISLHYNIPHISTGNLLRDEINAGTQTGKEVERIVAQGKLADDETVISLLSNRILNDDCKNGFLLDGFPRTLAQAKRTELITGVIDKVIAVHVEDAVIVERMSGRRICKDCGTTYHMVYKPPKKAYTCDLCGGKLIQRDDDKRRTVKHRLEIYHNEADPIQEFFESEGKLAVVDGLGAIEEITNEIITKIGK
jgi:adenylate kinase